MLSALIRQFGCTVASAYVKVTRTFEPCIAYNAQPNFDLAEVPPDYQNITKLFDDRICQQLDPSRLARSGA
jgi:hypothetical protein